MDVLLCAKQSLVGSERPILVNIGAERGDGETTDFCTIAPEAEVYSIEADPRTFAQLDTRRAQFPNLRTFNIAIADKDEKRTFFLSGGKNPAEHLKVNWTSASNLFSRERNRNGQHYPWMTYEEVEVQCRTLDSWAEENNVDHIDFLWVDIEGATHLLIEGGRKTLAKTKWLYTEAFDWARYDGEGLKSQIVSMLPDFQLVADYGNDILLKNTKL
jgi:FkbM family methyltransferase